MKIQMVTAVLFAVILHVAANPISAITMDQEIPEDILNEADTEEDHENLLGDCASSSAGPRRQVQQQVVQMRGQNQAAAAAAAALANQQLLNMLANMVQVDQYDAGFADY
jgi:hypothetical protein